MTPPGVDCSLRDLAGMEDMRECETIQKEVWGFFELDVVPAGLFAVMVHYGAVSIGAFVGGRMAAFVSGFPGYGEEGPFHHSHMLAVRPGFQGRGIGLALKWAQAERVRARGISRINWTFDPLQAPNANLNINHLGCVVSVYRVNVYGESQSPLHAGIPTDRLEPEWWLDSERVARARRGDLMPAPGIPELPAVNRVRVRPDGLPESSDPGEPQDREILFHIPPDLLRIIARDPGLAMDWRLKSRAGFQALFERGYEVRGFHRAKNEAAYRLRA